MLVPAALVHKFDDRRGLGRGALGIAAQALEGKLWSSGEAEGGRGVRRRRRLWGLGENAVSLQKLMAMTLEATKIAPLPRCR